MKERLSDLADYIEDLLGVRSMRLLIMGLDKKLDKITLELRTMSENLSTQLDAALASVNSALDALSADVSSIASEVTALVAGMTPGSTITQAQIDAANALAARVSALDTQAKSIVAQGQPTPPADQNPPTP